jgi:hypothetical protein
MPCFILLSLPPSLCLETISLNRGTKQQNAFFQEMKKKIIKLNFPRHARARQRWLRPSAAMARRK